MVEVRAITTGRRCFGMNLANDSSRDMKMRMCIIAGIIILLVVIIVPSGTFHGRFLGYHGKH